jgi:hypothetical protein
MVSVHDERTWTIDRPSLYDFNFAAPIVDYDFPDDDRLEISVAPQDVLCPSNATARPLIFTFSSPSAITQSRWPLVGQVHLSPMRATPLPITSDVSLPVTTLPP